MGAPRVPPLLGLADVSPCLLGCGGNRLSAGRPGRGGAPVWSGTWPRPAVALGDGFIEVRRHPLRRTHREGTPQAGVAL